MKNFPKKDSVWQHKTTGETYTVIVVSNKSATRFGWDITVVYRDYCREVWSRPLSEWNDKLIQSKE
jgi:hypothetical protein